MRHTWRWDGALIRRLCVCDSMQAEGDDKPKRGWKVGPEDFSLCCVIGQGEEEEEVLEQQGSFMKVSQLVIIAFLTYFEMLVSASRRIWPRAAGARQV